MSHRVLKDSVAKEPSIFDSIHGWTILAWQRMQHTLVRSDEEEPIQKNRNSKKPKTIQAKLNHQNPYI